jgi:acetyltransferase-like isoleucine patch superfamily enzyme
VIREFVLKTRRAETPFYRKLKSIARAFHSARLPLPRFMHPALRMGYYAQHSAKITAKWFVNRIYREPLFRGRCNSVGKNFKLYRLPFIIGHAEIQIGDDVTFYGQVDIFSGRIFDHPRLVVGDRVSMGHGVSMVVNKEIVIEDGVNISSGVRIMDTDSHPRDAEARVAGLPPFAEEVKAVRIGRYAWIGEHSYIMKGVTIGEGAIVGVNSVVVTDIPAYSIAMGNPARVVLKGGLKPAAVVVEQAS